MAGTNHFSQQLLDQALNGATVRCMLLDTSTSYTYAPEDEFVGDLPTGAEPTDGSYSRLDVSNPTFTQDDSNDRGVFDCDDVTFSSLSTANEIQTVVFYAQDGLGSAGTDDSTPGDDVIVAVFDDDSGESGSGVSELPKPTNGSDFLIQISADGLFNISTPT